MAVTFLAILFLLLIITIAFLGFRTMFRKGAIVSNTDMEKCALCREKFGKDQLILRQVGDYKLLYFCRKCVLGLYGDLGLKN